MNVVLLLLSLFISGHEFPGLYIEELPRHCWAADNTTVVVSSGWHSKVELLAVNTLSGDLIKLSRDEAIGRWQALCIRDNIVIAALSSLNAMPQVKEQDTFILKEYMNVCDNSIVASVF